MCCFVITQDHVLRLVTVNAVHMGSVLVVLPHVFVMKDAMIEEIAVRISMLHALQVW